jgi:hypothetical protein
MKVLDKIQENLKKVLKNIHDSYDEEIDAVEEKSYMSPSTEEYNEDYEDVVEHNKSWENCNWHCIRCGDLLITENNLDFACTNTDCFHYIGILKNYSLRLHHPASYNTDAGDSYSISYYK